MAQHLVAWNDYQGAPNTLYYWRTRYGVEVDFIIYGPSGLWAIEVKNSKQLNMQDVRGLQTFCEDYPEAKPVLLYRGKENLQINQIPCMPVDVFLKQLIPGNLLPL